MNTKDLKKQVPIDEVNVAERVARMSSRSIKKESKVQALKLVLSMIDHTTLEGEDTPGRVIQLCNKAKQPYFGRTDIPHVAAVCVYPQLVSTAKKAVGDSGVQIASVATSFPSGMGELQAKLDEVRFCVDSGADEIDMVISRGRYHNGDYNYVYDEIAAVKEAFGKAHLKVILETGELGPLDNVRHASDIAMQAGADFIKTSTGKISPAATMPVTLVMLEAIRDHYYRTGVKIGMKPAGGIRDAKTSLKYLVMVKETLGADWLTPDLFRFGASSLTNDVLMQIIKQQEGRYQSADYFTID